MRLERRWLDELTWPDVESYLAGDPRRVIVPLGATENHGPHAPLGTDTIIARAVAARLAVHLDALAAPVLPFGHSPHHLAFPGTVSWSNRLVADALVATSTDLVRHGFETVVFYSGHGGNKLAIDLAAGELADRFPQVRVVHAHQLAVQTSPDFRDRVAHALGRPLTGLWGAHGGEQETAAVLAERPELVRVDRFPTPPEIDAYLTRTRDPAVTMIERDLRSHAPQGTWGHPDRADAEQGTAFLDHVASELAERVLALLRTDEEDPTT